MREINFIVLGTTITIFMIGFAMWGYPQYNVWASNLSGKAELVKAEQNRQIKIQEAKALKESAQFQADAEIIRAKGVAQSNKIIADGLKDNEGYLKYLWINAMTDNEKVSTVYIPVGQNGLPIMKEVQ